MIAHSQGVQTLCDQLLCSLMTPLSENEKRLVRNRRNAQSNAYDTSKDLLPSTVVTLEAYARDNIDFLKDVSKQGSPFERAAALVILRDIVGASI